MKGNKAIFQNNDNPPLDSLLDTNNNTLTNPLDIADEIFIQQSKINTPTVQLCKQQPHHPHNCTCQVRQYPWHDLNGFTLENRRDANSTIATLFTREIYDLCVKTYQKIKPQALTKFRIPY
jgi:hypothetical protein